jgi:hypothetical protein
MLKIGSIQQDILVLNMKLSNYGVQTENLLNGVVGLVD